MLPISHPETHVEIGLREKLGSREINTDLLELLMTDEDRVKTTLLFIMMAGLLSF